MGKDCPFTHSQKKKWCTSQNGKGKESENDRVSVAIVNVVFHRPNISSDTLFQFEISMNSQSKAEVNFRPKRRFRCPWNALLRWKKKHPSDRAASNSHITVRREQDSETLQSLNMIQTGNKNGRSPNAPPYDQICTEWNDEQEEFARHRSYTFDKERFTRQICSQNKVLHKLRLYTAKYTETGLAVHSKERVRTVDRWRFVTCGGIILSEPQRTKNHSTGKQHSENSDRQRYCGLRHTSECVHQENLGAHPLIHMVKDSPSVVVVGNITLWIG